MEAFCFRHPYKQGACQFFLPVDFSRVLLVFQGFPAQITGWTRKSGGLQHAENISRGAKSAGQGLQELPGWAKSAGYAHLMEALRSESRIQNYERR